MCNYKGKDYLYNLIMDYADYTTTLYRKNPT